MQKINFTKMVASGNDFVVVYANQFCRFKQSIFPLAKKICNRRLGIGADGLLLMEGSKKADIKMRIFNADGSEADMCGNGARCASYWYLENKGRGSKEINIETKAGIIESKITGSNVRIKLTSPKGLKLNIPVNFNKRVLRVNFINTGVPHAVIFVNGLEDIDVERIGGYIRFHKAFSPEGANVNFVEPLSKGVISVRTYERGVEAETLACGTGSVASALIAAYTLKAQGSGIIRVRTKSKEVLKVYFNQDSSSFNNNWLEGCVKKVYRGEYYV
jgi:diaminopimelate epimerase